MNELKPCPFCGGEAGIHFHSELNEYYISEIDAVYIYCKHCDATTGPFLKKEVAIEAWNRRVDNG